jgi:hypothetical protein
MSILATAFRPVLVVVAALWCISVAAEPLAPGATNVPIVEQHFEINPVAQTSRLFKFTVDMHVISGNVVDIVHRQPNGTLVFETEVTIDPVAQPTFEIDRVGRTKYEGFSTDAFPEPDRGGSLFPETADRSASGSQVTFNFLNGNRLLEDGAPSSFFAISTDATRYAEVGELFLHIAGVGSLPGIPVYSPVPEPAHVAWLLAGGTLLVLSLRRRGRL